MPTETRQAGPRRLGMALAAGLGVLGVATAVALLPSTPAYAADSATVNGATTYQTMAGFGASEAFGQASSRMNAPSAEQAQALSWLYSPTAGAGLTILRNEISADSGSTVEPTAPSSATATPSYVSLASINQDSGQLWLAQQIKSLYGVSDGSRSGWVPATRSTRRGTTVRRMPGSLGRSGSTRG